MSVTLANPVQVNSDGTVDILVKQGRTFSFAITVLNIVDPTGYKARFALKTSYAQSDDEALVIASSEPGETGTIDLTELPDSGGTLAVITIPDEDMEITATKGKWDVVFESVGGEETTVAAGSWILFKRVTP